MKLRTVVDEGRIKARNIGRLMTLPADTKHDALAAHALMMAMDEVTSPAHAAIFGMVKWRASELMRSWGFDTGEDA